VLGIGIDVKRRLLEILFAILIGVFSYYVFCSLYGLLAYIGLDLATIKLVGIFPSDYRIFGLILSEIIMQLSSTLPVIGILGIILGIIVAKNPKIYGLLAFISAILFYSYKQIFYYDFGFINSKYIPMWVYAVDVTIWAGLFTIFSTTGFKLKNLKSKANK